MTTLVVFTSLAPLLIKLTIEKFYQSSDVTVVDIDDDIHRELKEYRISSVPIRVAGNKSWSERDGMFKEVCLPGKQLDFNIPTTQLPTWKMISLDRLSFWFRGMTIKNEFETLMAMNWNNAIVAAELGHPLPWALARYSGRPVVGVKVGSFRTREWHDLLSVQSIPFDYIVVDKEADKQFLESNGYNRIQVA